MTNSLLRTAAIVACIGMLTGMPSLAEAERKAPRAKAPPSATDKRAAKRHYKNAQRLFDVGRFREALTLYERAFDAAPLPGFLFNIGQCHRNLKQYAEAIFTFRRYLRLAPNAKNRVEVETLIRELEAKKKRAKARARRARMVPQLPPPPSRRTPVYKRWWFYAGIVAVSTTATVLVVRSGGSGGVPASDLGDVDFSR